MDIVLNRRAGVSVRDQLVAHLEMQILSGALTAGKRLPSVRALARRLKVHPNTISAAYQELQTAGHVERRQGSGIFVCTHAPRSLDEARGLDEMIRMALQAAFRRGFTAAEVRGAVARWLAASPIDRVLVVDAERELAELLMAELARDLELPVRPMTIDELSQAPEQAAGALIVAHRYHAGRIGRLLPGAPIEPLNIQMPEEVRKGTARLPAGSMILMVSHSPALLPIGFALLQSMRGDELVVEARLRSAAKEWKPLLRSADLVVADVVSYPSVKEQTSRRVHEVRVVAAESIARVLGNLGTVSPGFEAADDARRAPRRR
jgi:DNA-binding transcriptional regulator YhcF (GntR family)